MLEGLCHASTVEEVQAGSVAELAEALDARYPRIRE